MTTTKDAVSTILNHGAHRYTFHFSPFLRQNFQVGLAPDRPICKAFQSGACPNGTRCTERHVADGPPSQAQIQLQQQQQQSGQQPGGGPAGGGGLNSLVCKHWLRGLCKKGEHCEFLHEYNLRKMPECNFFMRNGYCSNGEECLYLHVDPLSRLPPCPHYDMGFCPLGPRCAKKHVRRKPCGFYLAGFCPDGMECRVGAHPKWSKDLEKPVPKSAERPEDLAKASGDEQQGGGGGGSASGGRGEDGEGERFRDNNPRDREDRGFGGGRHGGRGGRGGWRGGGRGRFRGRGH